MSESFPNIRPWRKPGEHYKAKATVVGCFDDGFLPAFFEFIEVKGLDRKDAIILPGGAKSLSSPADEAHRKTMLWAIQTSVALHHSDTIILVLHENCGAYGGTEPDYKKELDAAEEYLRGFFPDTMKYEKWVSGFNGYRRLE
ncbi:MAG: hypothetical protein KGJ89_02570 [Patescibacteria group bacterium]|nr:hypothetical protein [Patescibacteria group bacterium]MDE2015762.1 hypothetical protein [Patescibacteria group bacterium]MDE2226819.1 hypothetical protein [Patescibacteria group bacterium]